VGDVQPRVLIVTAFAGEAATLRRRLSNPKKGVLGPCPTWQGPFAGCAATLLVGGVGPAAAKAAMARALDPPESPIPDLVLSLGVAGALRAGVPIGRAFVCDPLLAPEAPPLAPDGALAARAGLPSAPTVTVPVVAAKPAAKAALRARFGADLVEMESYWVAQACAASGVPWLALRAPLDRPGDDLSPVPEAGRSDVFRVGTFIATHPQLAWRFWRHLARCNASLADAAARVCESLASDTPAAPNATSRRSV
jgi:nucleoside phosphorylase